MKLRRSVPLIASASSPTVKVALAGVVERFVEVEARPGSRQESACRGVPRDVDPRTPSTPLGHHGRHEPVGIRLAGTRAGRRRGGGRRRRRHTPGRRSRGDGSPALGSRAARRSRLRRSPPGRRRPSSSRRSTRPWRRCGPTPPASEMRPCRPRSSRSRVLDREQIGSGMEANQHELEARKQAIDTRLDQVRGELRAEMQRLGADGARHRPAHLRAVRPGRRPAAGAGRGHPRAVELDASRCARRSPARRRAGQWGERMAEDVLRLAGFVENVNYVKQTQVDGGTRPARLHVPAAQGPRALHGRQVPDGGVPALPRRHTDEAERQPHRDAVPARRARAGARSWPTATTRARAPAVGRLRAAVPPQRAAHRVHPRERSGAARRRDRAEGRDVLAADAVRLPRR